MVALLVTFGAGFVVASVLWLAPPARAGRDHCPADAQFLITETMRASNIHKDFLENKRDAFPEWHIYWEKTHRDTALALLEATKGC